MGTFKSGVVFDYSCTDRVNWTRVGTHVARTLNYTRPIATKRKKPVDLRNNTTSWSVSSTLAVDGETVVPQKESVSVLKKYVVSSHAPLNASVAQQFVTTDTTAIAYGKALSDLKQERVNLGQMVAEYRQTANLFGSACEKFYKLAVAMRHRDPRVLVHDMYRRNGRLRDQVSRRTARKIADSWLEFIYGVVPLYNDVDEAMKALKQRFFDTIVYDFEGKHKVRQASVTRTNSLVGGGTVINAVTEVKQSRVELQVELNNELLLSSLGAYGFTNPFSLAWELIPFSFVVDWWINVGDVLASLDNCLYIKSGKWYSVQRYSYGRAISVLGGIGTFQQSSYSRSAKSPVTQTITRFRYKPSLSAIHCANGTALVASLLTGSRKSLTFQGLSE